MTNESQAPTSSRRGLYFVVLALVVGVWCFVQFAPERKTVARPIADAELKEMHPQADQPPGHAPSSACRECHEHNHQTWFDSYHRTMTQEVKPETVLGNFDDVTVDFPHFNNAMRLTKQDGYPWVEFEHAPDLSPGESGRKKFPLVMSTGSHHMQFYWFPLGAGKSVGIMPLGHLVKENRWIPIQHSFLTPPVNQFGTENSHWNDRCVRCHSTYPEINRTDTQKVFETRVTEFGISCEACHGPAGNHVAIQRNAKNPDPSFNTNLVDHVVNPKELDQELGTAVCAACHSIHRPGFWKPHQPGKPFGGGRRLIQLSEIRKRQQELALDSPENMPLEEEDATRGGEGMDEGMDSLFWADGKPLVTGGEYNSFLMTSCFTKGELSCTSCHKLHQSRNDDRARKDWANDQLKHTALDNQACTQCHDQADYESAKHTHHAAGSSGSSCYNCHMPYTTYGLLTAIRSHTIYSPDTKAFHATGRPTACNLCHLDQTLEWTAQHLEDWYGIEPPTLTEEDKTVSNAAALALRGDARVRALVAHAMGWKPALEASSTDWIPAYLSTLLKDPYAAVRYIAEKSLRQQAGFADIKADFVDLPAVYKVTAEEAMKRWISRTPTQPGKRDAAAVLLDEDGRLNEQKFNEIYARRDNRDISVEE